MRVWREDRGIDRITGFRSRTERDGRLQKRERKREREEGWGIQGQEGCQHLPN